MTPDYFRAIGIPVRAGREFLPADSTGPRAVIVNQTFVDRYMSGRSPVGATYVVAEDRQRLHQIVGVVNFVRTFTLGEDEQPQVYALWTQTDSTQTTVHFVLRSTGDPSAQLKTVQAALRAVDSGVGVDVSTLRAKMGLAFLPSQIGAALMSVAGGLALLLVATGLFGTMAFAVTRRTREIGLRLAIGATRGNVVRMVLADSVRLLGIGLAAGAAHCVVRHAPAGRVSRARADADRSDDLCAGLRGDADDRRGRDLDSRAPRRGDRSDGVSTTGVICGSVLRVHGSGFWFMVAECGVLTLNL